MSVNDVTTTRPNTRQLCCRWYFPQLHECGFQVILIIFCRIWGRYTLSFTFPQRNKSQTIKSGKRVGYFNSTESVCLFRNVTCNLTINVDNWVQVSCRIVDQDISFRHLLTFTSSENWFSDWPSAPYQLVIILRSR